MSIGYACLTLGVRNSDLKTCLIKNADEARLNALIASNLDALEKMVDYNIKNGICLFRISSDIIPFASNPVNRIPGRSPLMRGWTLSGRRSAKAACACPCIRGSTRCSIPPTKRPLKTRSGTFSITPTSLTV